VIVSSPIQAVGTRKAAAPVVDDGASRGDVTMPTNASSVARVNGIELGYQVVGEGKPLILLHGGRPRSTRPTSGSRRGVEDWPVLVRQVTEVVKIDDDWSAEIPGLPMPLMLVIGDAEVKGEEIKAKAG